MTILNPSSCQKNIRSTYSWESKTYPCISCSELTDKSLCQPFHSSIKGHQLFSEAVNDIYVITYVMTFIYLSLKCVLSLWGVTFANTKYTFTEHCFAARVRQTTKNEVNFSTRNSAQIELQIFEPNGRQDNLNKIKGKKWQANFSLKKKCTVKM